MTDAVISYTDEETGLTFRWHGGAYIDVGFLDVTMEGYVLVGSDYGPSFSATDVINVWDDENDRSIWEVETETWGEPPYDGRPFRYILEMFEKRCEDYLKEQVSEDA